VDYLLGLAKNKRLEAMITAEMEKSKRKYLRTKLPARTFRSFGYRTKSTWSKKRRVIGKAEYMSQGENPRFVVTTIPGIEHDARTIYEDLYCARGNMENRLKEQQMGLFADRTSTHRMRSNQLRLYFSSIAYILMHELRRIGLRRTELASAQCWTIRERLFKIGAVVIVSFRRIRLALSSACPAREVFVRCLQELRLHYATVT
jgi:hypothetical protein